MVPRPADDFRLDPKQFEVIRKMLGTYSGIHFDQVSERQLSMAVNQRQQATGLSTGGYVAHIAATAGRRELHLLVEQLLNHETIFFRNLPHMQALRDVVLPQLHRTRPRTEPLRLWSAGCSTGEEAYSLAITCCEALGYPLPRPITIWATDLSEAALAKAQQGSYRGRTLSNVAPPILTRYFERRDDQWVVRKHIRDLIRFEQLNLLHPFPQAAIGCDIIFCQNVTIYFDLPTFRNLVDRFYTALPERGLLFLGFSETLWNVYERFRLQEINGAFIYKKVEQELAPPPPAPARAGGAVAPRTMRTADGSKPTRPAPTAASALPNTAQAQQDKTQPRWRHKKRTTDPVLQPSGEDTDVVQRGSEMLNLGRADEALAMLYQVPLNGPHAPEVLALIARAHANRGAFDLAVAEAHRALDLDSLTTEAYFLLGVVYAQQGQWHIASQQFERARYLDPDSALISFHLAEVYRQQDRLDMALREYRNSLRKLATCPPDALLDGVAVGWIRETCERHIALLAGKRKE